MGGLNVIDYYNGQITDIMPQNIKDDPAVQAISFSISNMVKVIADASKKTSVYAVIDILEEDALDLLAVELRAKYYGELLTLKEKREIIKKTLLWYYKAGTLYAVQELTDFVFQDAGVEEWFQYCSEAYLFRLIVNVISQDVSLEKYMKFIKSVYGVKNTRSHLEAVIFRYMKKEEVKSVAAGGIGHIIKIKARTARKVGAAARDRPASALFLNQNILIKGGDDIGENDAYILSETGKKVRVLTENGGIVRI